MQRYNRTNFVSQGFAQRLLHAMHECITQGFHAYVENSNGRRWLRVAIVAESGRYSFQFLAENGQDVGFLILQALFSWSPYDEREFLTVVQKLYSMTEHPLIHNRRVALEAARESEVVAQTRATVKVYHHDGRFLGLGRYERRASNWFRNRLYLLTDGRLRVYGAALLANEDVCHTEALPLEVHPTGSYVPFSQAMECYA